jgi:two-component system, chemotaxis family, CheB/CheR fusion protein
LTVISWYEALRRQSRGYSILISGDRGRPLTDIAGRIDYPELENDIRAISVGGEIVERTVSVPGGNGDYLARVLPYKGANNELDGVLLTFVDVTNILAAEEQQKVLTAEFSHRVKNTLAVVSSIAERTLPDSQAKSGLIGRFHTLGQTHDLLSQSGWNEAALHDLILSEFAPHSVGDHADIRVNGRRSC